MEICDAKGLDKEISVIFHCMGVRNQLLKLIIFLTARGNIFVLITNGSQMGFMTWGIRPKRSILGLKGQQFWAYNDKLNDNLLKAQCFTLSY